MITNYAETNHHWQSWQQEYRYGVLLLFPAEPLRSQVNQLRNHHDPVSQATCDAHISLTVPLPGPISTMQWQELITIAAAIPAIPIRYGPLMNYLPHPGVCIAIEPQQELDQLRMALESASVFASAVERRYPFSAHMTIAEFISVEQTEEFMVELESLAPQGMFTCDSVAYAVPDEHFHFTERGQLRLSGV
ncbi:MAG: 2'-5' RNA ligase family protein [Caldilineaceae bacterium]